MELPTAGVHWQGNYNQTNRKHKPQQPTNVAAFYRLTVSCCESPQVLQEEGINFLLRQKKNMPVMPVHGWDGDKDYPIRVRLFTNSLDIPQNTLLMPGLATKETVGFLLTKPVAVNPHDINAPLNDSASSQFIDMLRL